MAVTVLLAVHWIVRVLVLATFLNGSAENDE